MSEPSGYERRKDPEGVRRAVLDCAARLAAERGPAGVTVDAVAKAAGVTKGGLFHHFPSKHVLIQSLFDDLLAQLDAAIDAGMAKETATHGRFTRAYVEAVFADPALGGTGPAIGFPATLLADPELQRRWADWMAARLERHADTDGDGLCEVVRLAVDGVWLALITTPAKAPVNFPRAREAMLSLATSQA